MRFVHSFFAYDGLLLPLTAFTSTSLTHFRPWDYCMLTLEACTLVLDALTHDLADAIKVCPCFGVI